MSFSHYFLNIYTLMGLAALLLTATFALWKGQAPERAGVFILCLSAIGGDLGRAASGQLAPTIIMFSSDVLLSLGFLYIAIRYSSLWLGAAMMFQGCALATHAAQMQDASFPRWRGMLIYLLIHNLLSYLVMLSLFGGTLASLRRQRKLAHEKTLAAAKASPRATITHRPPRLADNL